jgi:hypothetical protein
MGLDTGFSKHGEGIGVGRKNIATEYRERGNRFCVDTA